MPYADKNRQREYMRLLMRKRRSQQNNKPKEWIKNDPGVLESREPYH